MLSRLTAALNQNASSLVPQLFYMNVASGGMKASLKMDGSNGKFLFIIFKYKIRRNSSFSLTIFTVPSLNRN